MSTIHWNRKCPNCTGKTPDEIETIERLFEWAKPGMFPGTCWYCQDTGRELMIPLEYLNLLETRSCEHYGISVDADREIEECLGLPTGTGLESVPIPLPQSPSQILYFTDSGADVPDVEVRASFSYLTKGNFNLGLQRSVLSLPFEFTANGEEWERTMVELRLTFSFLVHVYRAGVSEQFILRSRLTQTRVLLSPRMINPNDTTETRLLPETERLFVYPMKGAI